MKYAHEVVNHLETYVQGRVHANGLENFWSLLSGEVLGKRQLPVAIWAFALIIALLIATVGLRFVYNARRKYAGELQQNTSFARVLGEEIYWALEGTIQNLPKGDQRQCYTTLVEAVPKSKHFHSAAQKE